jgi:hypothetical protein
MASCEENKLPIINPEGCPLKVKPCSLCEKLSDQGRLLLCRRMVEAYELSRQIVQKKGRLDMVELFNLLGDEHLGYQSPGKITNLKKDLKEVENGICRVSVQALSRGVNRALNKVAELAVTINDPVVDGEYLERVGKFGVVPTSCLKAGSEERVSFHLGPRSPYTNNDCNLSR